MAFNITPTTTLPTEYEANRLTAHFQVLHRFLRQSLLSGLRTLKVLIWSTFVSSSQLAQLVERGANKGKVMCSMLKE